MTVTLEHYLVVSAFLFASGVVCIVLKRSAIGILMGVELILAAATVNLVAFNHYRWGGSAITPQITGLMFSLFVIVLAAAEAAVALAMFLSFYRSHRTVDVEAARALGG
jgi:NADH-quinone oxidoreductase subunit K